MWDSTKATELVGDHLVECQGFPFPQWDRIFDWAEAKLGEDEHHGFTMDVASAWLDRIQVRLGPSYGRTESKNFVLISSEAPEANSRLLRLAEQYLSRCSDVLEGIEPEKIYGKRVLLQMADHQIYWEYLSCFYPDEGEWGGSVGVFLDRGYGHIALAPQHTAALEATLLHELAHNCMMFLDVPLWLNEALAMRIEVFAGLRSPLRLDQVKAERHYEFWNSESIQAFWSGKSFGWPGDGQTLSYELAEILLFQVLDLLQNDQRRLALFVSDAIYADAGNASALKHVGKTIGQIAMRFLGEDKWQPAPFSS